LTQSKGKNQDQLTQLSPWELDANTLGTTMNREKNKTPGTLGVHSALPQVWLPEQTFCIPTLFVTIFKLG
jgi:hypothetical protein